MVKDDDSVQVNGELVPDDIRSESAIGENPASPSAQPDSKSSTIDEEAFNVNSFKDETNSCLPSITISQRVYGGVGDNDEISDKDSNDKDKDVGTSDDIYNFEFSDDQKQAIQELFNLKLDLGFIEG